MTRPLYLLALPLLALAACAPSAPKDSSAQVAETGRRCAFSETIQGYTVEKDTLYLRAGSRVYQVEAAGFCPDLDTGISLGFRNPLGSGQVCVGDWMEIIPSGASMANVPCRARVTNLLTPQEVAALPEKLRPR